MFVIVSLYIINSEYSWTDDVIFKGLLNKSPILLYQLLATLPISFCFYCLTKVRKSLGDLILLTWLHVVKLSNWTTQTISTRSLSLKSLRFTL